MPKYDASLELEYVIDITDEIKGLGEVTARIVDEVDYTLEEALEELKEYLVNHPPAGLPTENLDEQIDIFVANGVGFISVDTRKATKIDTEKSTPEQEKKNVAWFVEYGTSKSPPRPFLRPLVTENLDRITKKVVNSVVENMETYIESLKAEAKDYRRVGEIKRAQILEGRAGGLTSSLNRLKEYNIDRNY